MVQGRNLPRSPARMFSIAALWIPFVILASLGMPDPYAPPGPTPAPPRR